MLEIAPHPLVRIEFGGIRRQELKRDPAGVFENETIDGDGLVRFHVVPHQDDSTAHVSKQVPQEHEHLRSGNRATSYQDVQLPLGAHPGDRRELRPAIAVGHDGRLPLRCPGPDAGRNQAEATLVGEDQRGFQPAGFFLIRGQSSRNQRRSLVSSRSMARAVGR